MQIDDIKEFETGHSCFGEILRVNGIDYEDLPEDVVINLINEFFKKDPNKYHIIRRCFEDCLEHLQFDCVENSYSSCEQCGDYNTYNKYKI